MPGLIAIYFRGFLLSIEESYFTSEQSGKHFSSVALKAGFSNKEFSDTTIYESSVWCPGVTILGVWASGSALFTFKNSIFSFALAYINSSTLLLILSTFIFPRIYFILLLAKQFGEICSPILFGLNAGFGLCFFYAIFLVPVRCAE